MPGYGYAAVAKDKSASWGALARDYLRGRPSLMRAFVLIDGRHGIKDSDEATMKALDAAAVSYAIVLTKRDEVKGADQPARVAATLEALRKHPAAYPGTFFTSARTGEGVPELRAHIAQLLAERGQRAPGRGRPSGNPAASPPMPRRQSVAAQLFALAPPAPPFRRRLCRPYIGLEAAKAVRSTSSGPSSVASGRRRGQRGDAK